MPLATAFADHCVDTRQVLLDQFGGYTHTSDSFGPFFNLTRDFTNAEIINYFSQCQGSRPELLAKLRYPEQVLAEQGFNFSSIVAGIEAKNMTLKRRVRSVFDSLETVHGDAVRLGNSLYSRLTCDATSPLYVAMRESICEELSPQLALSTQMYIMCAFFIFPAIICGAQGYKRFNTKNEQNPWDDLDEEDRRLIAEEMNMYEDDEVVEYEQPELGATLQGNTTYRPGSRQAWQ